MHLLPDPERRQAPQRDTTALLPKAELLRARECQPSELLAAGGPPLAPRRFLPARSPTLAAGAAARRL